MKQTLYEKIKTIVESGNIAITKGADGHYCLWSSITSTGSIRCSDTNKTLDECYDTLGSQLTTKSMINVISDSYIGIYERPLRRPKVGDEVQIIYGVYKGKVGIVTKQNEETTRLYCVIDIISKEEGVIMEYKYIPYDCIAPRVEIDE